MKVEAYCSCGGALRGQIQSKDEKKAQEAVRFFWKVHHFPNCGPVDAATARKARKASP